jgi:hypothetical protein
MSTARARRPRTMGTLVALLHEALEEQRRAFESDTDVRATDLVNWYARWRLRVRQAFHATARWTPQDAERAKRESWAIFECVDGRDSDRQMIQRDDRAERFADDGAMLAYLYGRARQGSYLHIKALFCDGRPVRPVGTQAKR